MCIRDRILSNILYPIEYSYGYTEVPTGYPTLSIAYLIYSTSQKSIVRTIPINRKSPKLIVQAIPIGRQSPKSIVRTIKNDCAY